MHTSFAIGFGLGFFVAAQLGPISLFLIRSVMRGAVITGLAIGAGAAVVDTGYACLGVLGAAPLVSIGALQLDARAGRRGGARRPRPADAVERVPRAAGRRDRR